MNKKTRKWKIRKSFTWSVRIHCFYFVFSCCLLHISNWWGGLRCLIKLANGQFSRSVKERTTVEKLAVIRFWRVKGKFTADVGGKISLFNNKQVRFFIHYFWISKIKFKFITTPWAYNDSLFIFWVFRVWNYCLSLNETFSSKEQNNITN